MRPVAAKRKERAISTPEFDHDTLIIGAGQAGLAMSRLLSETDHDHLVLEGGARIGGGWRKRWDSFTLVNLSVGSAGRLPRRYRGKDAFIWA